MCLAIPGKICSINNKRAQVDFKGIKQDISVELVPNVKVDDYVMVHAGYAIEIVDNSRANETLALVESLEEMAKTS